MHGTAQLGLMTSVTAVRPTVYGKKEQPLWLNKVDKLVEVVKNLEQHFRLCGLAVWIVAVSAVVDDAVHVKVQVIDDGDSDRGSGHID